MDHPFVSDCAVIPVADEMASEVPKAYLVASSITPKDSEMAARDIRQFVQDHKSVHKWLAGGREFADVIPKSPSGKILGGSLRTGRNRRHGAQSCRALRQFIRNLSSHDETKILSNNYRTVLFIEH